MADSRKKVRQYETLKKVRKIKEDQQMIVLAEARRNVFARQNQIQFLEELRDRAYNEVLSRGRKEVDVSDLMRYQIYLRQVHLKTLLAIESEKEARVGAEKELNSLVQLKQQREIVENLIEKEKKRQAESKVREDRRQEDEISVNFFKLWSLRSKLKRLNPKS